MTGIISWLFEFDPLKQPFRWALRRLTIYLSVMAMTAAGVIIYAFVLSLLR